MSTSTTTLDHVTIRTGSLEQTKAFFINLFGLVEKSRPKAIQHIPGHWLYSDDKPVVHLIQSFGTHYSMAAEAIDHVGFLRDDYEAFVKKLDEMNIHYGSSIIEELHEHRIFLRAPGGPVLEVVFRDAA